MNMLTTRETEIISALLLAEEIACKKAAWSMAALLFYLQDEDQIFFSYSSE